MTTYLTDPLGLDMGETAAAYSADLIGSATELMAVPLATEAAQVARPGEPFGALLAEQLSTISGDTFTTVMDRYPSLLDAVRSDSPVVVSVLQLVEETVDRLISAGFEFAGIAGAVR